MHAAKSPWSYLEQNPVLASAETPFMTVLQNEMVQREQESKRLFEEAMEYGYVEARLTVLLLIGAAGAGKTHAKELFLGHPPPTIRQSTPLAEEAIRAISILRATISSTDAIVWELVNREQLKKLIAEAVKAIRRFTHQQSGETDNSTKDLAPEPHPFPLSTDTQSSLHHNYSPNSYSSGHGLEDPPGAFLSATSAAETASGASSIPTPHPDSQSQITVDKELLDLIGSAKGSQKLFEVDWVYLIDSGGQPSFYEILPLFIRIATVVAFILKLNERLGDKPTVEFYGEDGQPCGRSCSSPLTNEQLLRHCLRSMQSRKSPSQSSTGPKIFVVGTHKDHEAPCPESRSDKNAKLLEMLRTCFPDDSLAFYRTTKPEELIYPINAKTPSEEDQKVAEQFRREVCKAGEQVKIKVPLPWYVLEQNLQKLSLEKAQKILSTDECEDEARKLRMKWDVCEAALQYLDKLNLFFYRPEYLKGVVFCGSQVWLDKITELIELMYRLQGLVDSGVFSSWLRRLVGVPLQTMSPNQPSGAAGPDVSDCLGPEWLRFRDYAIVTEGILKKFPRHYVYDGELFTPVKLLELLTAFQVTAPITVGSDEYIMPCLLREVPPQELIKHRQFDSSSPAAPLLIHFPGHWVPAGVFTILTSCLQNVFHWKLSLSPSRNPTCFYRNCVAFNLPTGHRGSIILVDSFEYLEVHVVRAKPKACMKACPKVRQDVINAIKQAGERLHYGALEPQEAFFCSNSNEMCSIEPHLAEVIDDDELVCLVNREIGEELTYRHLVWLNEKTVLVKDSVRVLSLSDLSQLLTILAPAAYTSVQLGIQLRLHPNFVQTLRQQAMGNPDPIAHLTLVLTNWLQQISPPATVQALVNALSSPTINNTALGLQVQQAFS